MSDTILGYIFQIDPFVLIVMIALAVYLVKLGQALDRYLRLKRIVDRFHT